MSPALAPSRRRRHEPAVATSVALALGLALASAAFAWVALRAPSGVPLRSYYSLHARFDDLAGLSKHSDIRIAGRRVGQVLRPRVVDGSAAADLQLDRSVEPLRAGTRLLVRSQGLLGQRYLQLVPSRSGRPLADGTWLPAARAGATVQLTDLLSAFDARRRKELHTTINTFGEGTLGRGVALNEAIGDAPDVLRGLRTFSGAVLAHDAAARRFFPSLASAASAARPVRHAIATGLRPEASALRPFAHEQDSVARALDAAPHALAQTRAGLAATDPMLVQLGRLSGAVRRMLRPAPSALSETHTLLREARAPFQGAVPVLRRIPSTVPSALRLTAAARPELPRLTAGLRASLDPLRVLGDRGCDVLGWASNWASMLSWGVGGGGPIGPLNVFRLELIGNNQSIGGLSSAPGPAHGDNPYPAPCTAGKEAAP